MGGQFAMLSILYVLVLAVVLLDLWSGVRKARRRGEFRSSRGLRKTVTKLAGYFNMMLVLTVIDVMLIVAVDFLNPQISVRIPLFPILTLLGAVFVGIIELRSVYEKAGDKQRSSYAEAARLARSLVYDRSVKEVLEKLAHYLKSPENDGDGTEA